MAVMFKVFCSSGFTALNINCFCCVLERSIIKLMSQQQITNWSISCVPQYLLQAGNDFKTSIREQRVWITIERNSS